MMVKSLIQHLKLRGEYTQIICNNTERIKVKKDNVIFYFASTVNKSQKTTTTTAINIITTSLSSLRLYVL